jgi:hypothetical protein
MKRFCIYAIIELKKCPALLFGETFVRLRMEFYRKHSNGLICSTALGADFFSTLLDCINGEEWDKKEHKGEYEDNFRKLIQMGQAEA